MSETDSRPEQAHDDRTRIVPRGMLVGAEFAWRFLVIVAALGVLAWVVGKLSMLAISLAVALLLAALMSPLVNVLTDRARLPRPLAAALAIVGGLGLLGGLITFVIVQFADGVPALQEQVNNSLDEIRRWLIDGPLALETEDIHNFINQMITFIQENQASVTTGALTTATAVGQFFTGFLLTLFILIFFVIHGDRIWKFVLYAVPGEVRPNVDIAGRRGFESLVNFVRATAVVAVVDAVGIGIGLWILQVPLVVPLATLVFIGAFVPIVGAVVTGAVAVLVALVTVGWVQALILLGIVILVNQIEGNALQPLLLGRAVRLHPLAVILAITAGLILAGIAGALISVPLVAVLNAGIKSLIEQNGAEPVPVAGDGADEPPPDDEEPEDE